MMRIALILCLSLSACTFRIRASASLYVRAQAVNVQQQCPPLQQATETRPAKTDSRSLWVAGHWRYEDDWVWIEGTWIVAREGYTWEPPVCVVDDGAHRFHPGYFRPIDVRPPPVYREPGHIRMSCPAEDEPEDVPERIVIAPGVDVPRRTGPGVTGPTLPEQGGSSTDPTVDRPNVDRPGVDVPGDNPTLDANGNPINPSVDVDRPGVDVPSNGNTVPTNPSGPGTNPPGTTDNPQTPLTCSVLVTRVPASGYVTLRGTGFTDNTTVTIGGTVAGIQRRSATELVVQARAGAVTVTEGGRTAECGSVELMRGR